jgi:DNA-binding GntR family transcriptional regulator
VNGFAATKDKVRDDTPRQRTEPMSPLVKLSLVDQIVDTLRERISSGEFVAGETLRIERLARELGISRTPVREAISNLEAQGMVVRRPGYAPTVFMPLADEVLEYCEMRMVLEPLAGRLALPGVTRDQKSQLGALIEAMDQFDTVNWFGLNQQFHHLLYAASNRQVLLETIDNLIVRSHPYVRIYFQTHDLQLTQQGHRRILDSVRRSDEAELVAAIGDHLQHVVNGILESIEAGSPPSLHRPEGSGESVDRANEGE